MEEKPQQKTTQGIIASFPKKSLYPSKEDEYSFFISSTSRWTDRTWRFDGKKPGASIASVSIVWNFALPDGTTLLDDRNSTKLHEFRCYLWGMISDRRNGRAMQTSAVGYEAIGIRALARWMVKFNYSCFGELDTRAWERYLDWVSETLLHPEPEETELDSELDEIISEQTVHNGNGVNPRQKQFDEGSLDAKGAEEKEIHENTDCGNDEGGITSGAVSSYIGIWWNLWRQRDALQKAGIVGIPNNPLSDKSLAAKSAELATKLTERIPALPDSVAISIMNAAHRFMNAASDDLIRLVTLLLEGRSLPPHLQEAVYANISFTIPTDGYAMWPPLVDKASPLFRIRELLDDLVDACSIIILSETGMRPGELCSTVAGKNIETGLPSCIEVRLSKSGMMDLFYLRATLSKWRSTPTQEIWLLGARPRGTSEMPNAVRAVQVLQDLLEPFRKIASEPICHDLLIQFHNPRGLPLYSSGVSIIDSQRVLKGQRRFASQYVDWPPLESDANARRYVETSGWCMITYQWRKTYAEFVFQIDRRMLAAISRQFKHLSLAMTEGAYVGTNIGVAKGIAEHNRNMTIDLLLQNARGTTGKQEGRLAKLMEKHREELQRIIADLNEREAHEAMGRWCDARQLKLFFHGYGKCIPAFAPTEAECHKRAHTVHWANKEPNYSTREPSVCTGCQIFLAGEETIDYWSQRYKDNMTEWLLADKCGEGKQFRVSKARAEQSAIYLKVLGATLPTLDTNRAG